MNECSRMFKIHGVGQRRRACGRCRARGCSAARRRTAARSGARAPPLAGGRARSVCAGTQRSRRPASSPAPDNEAASPAATQNTGLTLLLALLAMPNM